MSDPRPIGIFDSGVGGLTVARAIFDLLPNEPILYVGDNARFPYGPRPLEEIRTFALEIAGYLTERDVKMLVVACNSIEVAAIADVADAHGVPVVGVIDPGVRAAVHATRNHRIGLIGTEATVASGAYQRAIAQTGADVQLFSAACPVFVEHVEAGDTSSDELLEAARGYLVRLDEEDRHPDPGVHALPDALGDDPHGDGGGCPAGVIGRGDRQGRIRDASRVLVAAGGQGRGKRRGSARVPHDRRPRAVPKGRAPFPRPGRGRGRPRRRPGGRGGLVELTVLGSSGTWPNADTATSGYLVQHDGFNLWMDAGTGTLANLQQYIDIPDLHAIVISHEHPDHFVDLYPAFYAWHYGELGEPGFPVFVPTDFSQRLADLVSIDSQVAMRTAFAFTEVAPGEAFEIGPFRVKTEPMAHLGLPALGFRVAVDGQVLAYTGDTGPTHHVEVLARDADLLLAEATWQDRDDLLPFHMSSPAGRGSRAGGGRREACAHPHLAVARSRDLEGPGCRGVPRPDRQRRRGHALRGRFVTVRPDGRATDELRPVAVELGFQEWAEGSVLFSMGRTKVLVAATVQDEAPRWLRGSGSGWVTGEYAMLPRATTERTFREVNKGRPSGRTQEIQRLIGRSLRAVTDLKRLGERTITIDCDVLVADAGTRCASITGGYIALALALRGLAERRAIEGDLLTDTVAAVSVGLRRRSRAARSLLRGGRGRRGGLQRGDDGFGASGRDPGDRRGRAVLPGRPRCAGRSRRGRDQTADADPTRRARVAGALPRAPRDRDEERPQAPRARSHLPRLARPVAHRGEPSRALARRPGTSRHLPRQRPREGARDRVGAARAGDRRRLRHRGRRARGRARAALGAVRREGASDAENLAKLVEVIADEPSDARTARYRCVAAIAWPDGRALHAEGVCDGTLVAAPREAGGSATTRSSSPRVSIGRWPSSRTRRRTGSATAVTRSAPSGT